MAEMRLRNEFGLNRTLAIVEPAKKCKARCTWCYVELNRRSNEATGSRNLDDDGSFERTVEKAFGPNYDPTSLIQWQLRNRVPFVFSSGVEPFQDVVQARSILGMARQLNLPIFLQTRGTNWEAVWPDVEALAGNVGLYVSLPSLDPRYIKRFEPGTPAIGERVALIRAAASAGIPVMVAVAPYHPDWCDDLPELVRRAKSWGATDIFLDVLHLNRRQKEVIGRGGDRLLLDLVKTAWTEEAQVQWSLAYAECLGLGMGFETAYPGAEVLELFPAESPDPWPYRSATRWPYVESAFYSGLHDEYEYGPEHGGEGPGSGPILLDWVDALAAMERDGAVDQPFSMESMRDLFVVKDLAPAWKRALGEAAPARDYLRAIWNSPRDSGAAFPWNHPFVRMAARPDGQPWRGADGSLVMAYDPAWPGKGLSRTFGSLDDLQWLTYQREGPDHAELQG